MKSVIIVILIGVTILAVAACGGSSNSEPTAAPAATAVPTETPLPSATRAPTSEPATMVSLGESVGACLAESIGADGAESALSNLVASTPEQEAALSKCLLAASLEDAQSAESSILACLTEELGEAVARVVESGLIPLTAEVTTILGNCVLSVSMATTAASASSATDPIVACLEESLSEDLARAVASGGIPITEVQETLLGNCVLSASLASSTTTTSLSGSVVACLEGSLGADSAAVVASGSQDLTNEQQAALGGCLLGSAVPESTTTSTTVTVGVMACLTKELGKDVAQVVASAVLPLSTSEEQILGNCVVMDALGLTP